MENHTEIEEYKEFNGKKNVMDYFGKGGKILLIYIILNIIFKIFPGMFLSRGLSAALSAVLAFFLAAFFICRKDFSVIMEGAFKTEKKPRAKTFQGVTDYFFGLFLGAMVLWVIAGIVDLFGEEIFLDISVLPSLKGFSGAVFVIYSCMVAPIIYEILFRKVIMESLLPYGEKKAVFISALLYGLLSGIYVLFIVQFFVGIALAKTSLKCNSVMTLIKIGVISNCIINLTMLCKGTWCMWIMGFVCGGLMLFGLLRMMAGALRLKKREDLNMVFEKKHKILLAVCIMGIILEDLVYMAM